MDLLGTGLPIVMGLIGVAGALGFVSAYFLSNRAKTTIELQDQEIKAYKTRTDTLETNAIADKKQIELQEKQLRSMQELVTGKAATEALISHVVTSTESSTKEHGKMIVSLDKLVQKTDKTNQILTNTLKGNVAQNIEVNK